MMNVDKAARRVSDEKNGIGYHGVAGLLLSSPLRRARHNPDYTYGAPNVKPVPMSSAQRSAIAPPPKVTAAKRARTRLRPEGLGVMGGLQGPSPTYSTDGRTPTEEVLRGRLSAYCLCADLDTAALMATKSARVKISSKSSSAVVVPGPSGTRSNVPSLVESGSASLNDSNNNPLSPLLGGIKHTVGSLPTSSAIREGRASRTSIRGFKSLNTYDGAEGIGPEGQWKSTLHGGDIVHSILKDPSYPNEPAVVDTDVLTFSGRDKHVMYFPYGCVVFWGCDVLEEEELLGELKPYMKRPVTRDEFDNSHDDLEYVLPCHRNTEESTELAVESDIDKQTKFGRNIKYDTIFLETRDPYEKLSYAVAMAQSAKLSVFEDRLEQTIELNKTYPETMAQTGRIGLTDKQINQMIGKVLVERNEVNLHSDILDTPDFFWEMDRFEPHYDKLCRYLDIPSRVTVLNQRFEILERSLNVMQMQLTTKHSAKLEWIVIWLIVVEVALELIWGILVKDILGWYK